MQLNKKTITDVNLENKTVLLRADFNVPIENDKIIDTTRIKGALPTINYILEHNAKLVIFSHLGRVKTDEDKKRLTLAPVAKELGEELKKNVKFCDEPVGPKFENAVKSLEPGQIVLIQNTRYMDLEGKKESKNDPELGKYWASYGDVFVNDAFGTAHRSHASNVGIASHSKVSCIGFLIEKELKMLGQLVNNPSQPFVAILGGAKVSDKIAVIKNLLKLASKLLIGGGMAYTFLAAQGYNIGNSLVEKDKIEFAKELLSEANGKIVLPVDFAISKKYENSVPIYTKDGNVPNGYMGLDVGPKSVDEFSKIIQSAKTVFWNGPLGVYEFSNYAKATIEVCEAIAKLNSSLTIIGGGDSAAAAVENGFADSFSYISTGGGASLEFLEGKDLPGIAAIQNK